ncbi:MAG: hypothetical protein ACM4AI_16135 [Acidobacteriota bacterium]
MNTAHKGRRAEWKARTLLEAAGFSVCRAAASRGPCDLIAWDATSIRFVSVKSGSKYATAIEREQLARIPAVRASDTGPYVANASYPCLRSCTKAESLLEPHDAENPPRLPGHDRHDRDSGLW